LYFKLKGCCRGVQHYRFCTPHAVRQDSDLWCPFCMYDECAWTASRKALMASNELDFMQLIAACGQSEQWCHQVRLGFWKGCIDFYNWQDKVCVQIDGACHWHGISSCSAELVRKRDWTCNLSAWQAGVGLVRVHEDDLQQHQIVLAAVATAAAGSCVVFTASYVSKQWGHVSQLHQAVQLYCQVCLDAYGNAYFRKLNS